VKILKEVYREGIKEHNVGAGAGKINKRRNRKNY